MALVGGICGVGITAGACWCWTKAKAHVFRFISEKETGQQRRQAVPPSTDIGKNYLPGTFEEEASQKKAVNNERGFVTLRSGHNIFYQTWIPVDGDVQAVIIFFHGYGDHCDCTNAQKAKALCGLGKFAAAAFDMVGHGRSDGSFINIPNWLEFVDFAREVVVEHLKPLMARQLKQQNLKYFGLGESMGGGVLFSLLAREKTLFDGAILICPMLFVSRDIFPPWIVVQIFKHIMAPSLPLWPLAPNKDLSDCCNEDPMQRRFLNIEGNEDHYRLIPINIPPRLESAYQLAFTSGDWMQAKIPEYDVPSLIIHGGGDVVTDSRVSKTLYEDMKNKDKEFLYPDGVWHGDLFHGGPKHYDAVKQRFEAVLAWLNARSGDRTKPEAWF